MIKSQWKDFVVFIQLDFKLIVMVSVDKNQKLKNTMGYNPKIHHRRSIRLKGYDYSCSGAYFITICCEKHLCRFGKIVI